MKKVTFIRAIAPSKKRNEVERPDYPGYLVKLSNLPGVEIVIARESVTRADGKSWYFLPSKWLAFERETGLSIMGKTIVGRTRIECYERLVGTLCAYTPEKFAEFMVDQKVRRMTKLIQGESE